MKDSTRTLLISAGITLIGVALTPTPDDVTVVSPLLQLSVGAALITWGSLAK